MPASKNISGHTVYKKTKGMVNSETDSLILFFFIVIKRTIKLIITTWLKKTKGKVSDSTV